jgi:hypothetical protein
MIQKHYPHSKSAKQFIGGNLSIESVGYIYISFTIKHLLLKTVIYNSLMNINFEKLCVKIQIKCSQNMVINTRYKYIKQCCTIS